MQDPPLLRDHHQMLLPQVDVNGQQKLKQSKVLILGLGGLGSPVAMYLAAAGVGYLILVDFDQVELSNLQRQIIHDTTQLGQFKSQSAQTKLHALNPDIQIITINQRLEDHQLAAYLNEVNVVVDCSDNFTTRFAINAACVQTGIPLVSGAALRWEGQLTVFKPTWSKSPCYRCLYDVVVEESSETCSEAGILAPIVGIMGSLQAIEVIKILLDLGESLCGRLLLFNAHTLQWRTLKLYRDPACPVCSHNHFARESL